MPAFQKRIASNSPHSPKKAKLSPVQTKVQEVVAAMGNDNFQVAGSDLNRQMLLTLAPCILETPRDARQPKQEELCGILREVFDTEGARLKGKVTETQGEIDGAGADMTGRNAAVESADSDVQKKNAELKQKMSVLAADVGVARNAKSTLDETVSELTDIQESKDSHVAEQQDVASKAESFAVLKSGNFEGQAPKDQIKALGAFFKKLKVDASLVAALPMALGRRPEERSQFDALTNDELEKNLTSKVEECARILAEKEALLAEKTAVKETQEAALTAALAKQRAGAEALLQTRAEHKELAAVLADKKQHVKTGQIEYKGVEAEHFQRTKEVDFHAEVSSKLIELLERQTPEDAAPVVEEVAPAPVEGVVQG